MAETASRDSPCDASATIATGAPVAGPAGAGGFSFTATGIPSAADEPDTRKERERWRGGRTDGVGASGGREMLGGGGGEVGQRAGRRRRRRRRRSVESVRVLPALCFQPRPTAQTP
jgi:hypothetical protein